VAVAVVDVWLLLEPDGVVLETPAAIVSSSSAPYPHAMARDAAASEETAKVVTEEGTERFFMIRNPHQEQKSKTDKNTRIVNAHIGVRQARFIGCR
jgi:hypothetical protein